MKISVYPFALLEAPAAVAADPSAVIVWDEGELRIESKDSELQKTLWDFYSTPLRVRRAVSSKEGIVAFREVQIFPGTEEFFRESAYQIRRLSLFGKIEGERKVQLVALDFDGTLWDSVHECFVISCQAFNRLGWPVPAIANLEDKFKKGRHLVRTGAEFYPLLKWIFSHPAADPNSLTPDEEDAIRRANGEAAAFEKAFYMLRKEWGEHRFAEWAGLQSPYPGMLDQVRNIEKRFSKVVVATTKDQDSVKRLLAPYGVSLEVIGREHTVDKAKQMNYISAAFKKPLSQIVFIDDILDQVRVVKSIGVKAALAGWGYGSDRQKEEARRLGIPVLEIAHLADSLASLF